MSCRSREKSEFYRRFHFSVKCNWNTWLSRFLRQFPPKCFLTTEKMFTLMLHCKADKPNRFFFLSKHIYYRKLTRSESFSTAKTAEVLSARQLVHTYPEMHVTRPGSQDQQRPMCDLLLLLLLLLFLLTMILILGFTCPQTIHFKFITKCDKCYYKVRQFCYKVQRLLKSATASTVSFKQAILYQLFQRIRPFQKISYAIC